MAIVDKSNNLRDWNVDNLTGTIIKLYNASLNLTTGSQIWFESSDKQNEYFESCKVHEFENCTYVRIEEGFTMLPINVEQLRHECNYISIQNKGFDDRVYYCNLLSMDWVNMNNTKLNFAVDTIQTFMFDMDLSTQTHIVRRTYTSNDSKDDIWATLDENINTGVILRRVEQGVFLDHIGYDNVLTKDLYRPLSSASADRCYVLACSQALKKNDGGQFGVKYVSTLPLSTYTETFSGEELYECPLNVETGLGYGIMTNNYVCNDDGMRQLIDSGFLTNERNNGVVTQILGIQLPYSYVVDGDLYGDNPYGGYCGMSGNGKMCDLNDIRTYNEMTAFVGTEMMNYYSLALENAYSELTDKEYSDLLKQNNLRENPTVFNTTALMIYLMKPYLTRFTVNDHSNNIIDYDLRFVNNGLGLTDFRKDKDIITWNNLRYNISGYRLTILTYIGISPIPVTNWCLKDYGYNNSHTDYEYEKVYERQKSKLKINQNILNNDYWLKMIPSIYMPIVSDYYSAFLMANTYQLQAQRGNITRTYNTAIANAQATRDAYMNANWLTYQGNLASARALQANASIQYGASVQIAQNNYNNAIAMSNNSFKYAQANANAIYSGAMESANVMYGKDAQTDAFFGSLNLNPFSGFGISSGYFAQEKMGDQYTNATISADVQYDVAMNNATLAQQNASLNASNSYNNALIQASATAQMLKNTAQAQMTQAYNAYKGQQGILNANYQNELRNAATTQQNAIDMLNATIKDAQNVADTLTADYQGDNTMFITNSVSISYHFSVIQPEFMRRIINYFMMFGFTANTYDKPNRIINSWEKGGYIQTSNVIVNGDIPFQWKVDIANQFNSGIRFWKNPDEYLDYSVFLNQ